MVATKDQKPQLVCLIVLTSILVQFSSLIPAVLAAGSNGQTSESTSSSQPLWSYQVKPNSYVGSSNVQSNQYNAMPSIFDAFNGLSQRQGALTSSPFLSILPIILIAAGGMLLLLPLLTMMVASPFGGGGAFGGGFNGGFGYPQVGGLNKKRSLSDQATQRGLFEIFDHVSSSIDELTRKYSNGPAQQLDKRTRASSPATPNLHHTSTGSQVAPPANHKPTNVESATGSQAAGAS